MLFTYKDCNVGIPGLLAQNRIGSKPASVRHAEALVRLKLVSIGHQISHSAFQCSCQLLDSGDRHVPLTAFNHADEGAVKIGVHAKGFLR